VTRLEPRRSACLTQTVHIDAGKRARVGWVTAGNLPSRLCLLPAARCCCAVPLQCASRVCQGLQATGISRIGPVWRHCSAPSKLPRRDATALLRTPDGIWPRRCRITGWQQDGGMGEVWEVVWNGLPDGGDGARSAAACPPVLASIMPRRQGCQRRWSGGVPQLAPTGFAGCGPAR
jgi:hypothetical protein